MSLQQSLKLATFLDHGLQAVTTLFWNLHGWSLSFEAHMCLHELSEQHVAVSYTVHRYGRDAMINAEFLQIICLVTKTLAV